MKIVIIRTAVVWAIGIAEDIGCGVDRNIVLQEPSLISMMPQQVPTSERDVVVTRAIWHLEPMPGAPLVVHFDGNYSLQAYDEIDMGIIPLQLYKKQWDNIKSNGKRIVSLNN